MLNHLIPSQPHSSTTRPYFTTTYDFSIPYFQSSSSHYIHTSFPNTKRITPNITHFTAYTRSPTEWYYKTIDPDETHIIETKNPPRTHTNNDNKRPTKVVRKAWEGKDTHDLRFGRTLHWCFIINSFESFISKDRLAKH